MRRRMGAAALEMDAASDGSRQAQWRATVAARLPSRHWPEQPTLITAVATDTGEPVAFDRHSGVDLADAVAASCASGFAYGSGGSRHIVGVNPSLPTSENPAEAARDGVAARIDEKFAMVREAAGDRYDDLTFHGWLREAQVTDDGRGAAAKIAAATGLTEDDVLASPFVLVGSVAEIVERLQERRERWGYSYYTLQQPAAREFVPVIGALVSL